MMLKCHPIRTTIRIDDHLFREVKERAARTGRTIGAVIEDALRDSFSRMGGGRERPKPLPVYGTSGTMAGVDLDSNSDLLELMESENGSS
ncbi:MAG: ribbon-helix-helix protein, CopG family [Actinomycetota bacterium]